MLYMIIETFHTGKVKTLYERYDKLGRQMPDGLKYIDSWVREDFSTCFQLVETDTIDKIHEWIGHWDDLADFEIIPVISSAVAKAKVLS